MWKMEKLELTKIVKPNWRMMMKGEDEEKREKRTGSRRHDATLRTIK